MDQNKKQDRATDSIKVTIVLDTNFLLIPGQFKVDIFRELERIIDAPYRLVVLDATIDELKELRDKKGAKGRDKDAAKLALRLVQAKTETQNINIVTSAEPYVDQAILQMVQEDRKDKKLVVATQDQELKRLLKKAGTKTITLRQKKYLIIR
ncbi:TPA: hypothetical protein HA253_04320 [Candidatus Woesearchaeota archaeon]|nr:hypothetical protein [Candidatus Woesearchaeota archaeon]